MAQRKKRPQRKPRQRPRTANAAIAQAQRLLKNNDLDRAISLLETAIADNSDHAPLLEMLAELYESAGRTIDALKLLDRVIDTGAATATTWQRTAELLTSVREYAQAAGAYEHCLALGGGNAEARHNYGRVLYKLGNLADSTSQLEQATTLCDAVAPWEALAIAAPGNPDYNHADVLRIRQTLAKKLADISPACPQAPRIATSADRLRIGYVSSWFDRENYMKPVWGLINQHDRAQFEIHLFSDTSVANGIAGFQPQPGDQMHETGQLDNPQLAAAIQKAGIDILVDLNAYSTPARLGLFLSRPAPVTAAWFNMYATSGFPGFDYIIGDNVTVRPEEEIYYSEKVLRLPQSYLSFTVTHDAPTVVDPPSCQNGHITFGSLSTLYKMTSAVVEAWAAILQGVPNSRLLLGNADLDSACNRDFVADQFEARGIDTNRIEFRGRAGHRKFLEYYDAVDIALDSFPYNGGTTTMEAIWQGVPVITFDGDRWASRTSASILAGTHLTEFVAKDAVGYVQTATTLGNDANIVNKLRDLRHNMRTTLANSPACDSQALARAIESLYREIAITV